MEYKKYLLTFELADGTKQSLPISIPVGEKGEKGDRGDKGDRGEKGDTGQRGTDGVNGKDGVSVASIYKTASNGLVDTYTITLTNGSSTTFTVTNGARGEKGERGDKGEKGEQGIQGEKGEGFSISKTYASVTAMNEGFASDGVPLNGFVLINTGDVDDTDNAKLFVKLEGGYSYLTDLSGAHGIRGERGLQGAKGDKGEKGDLYVLSSADKSAIADLVLANFPVAEEASF